MKQLIIVRGGGDLATGTIWTLYRAGFAVLVLEARHPSAIRRTVAFSEAVYQGTQTVEDVTCVLAKDVMDARRMLLTGQLVMLVDEEARAIIAFRDDPEFTYIALVDAIIAKKNLGTTKEMAPFVIALGPGFTAGDDCHAVVETMRGHNLGRVYETGCAVPNTGVPGLIAGHAADRVVHAETAGTFYAQHAIGDIVRAGDVIGMIRQDEKETPVRALIDGLLRGILPDQYPVIAGFKLADIDPREHEAENCHTISDKSRCIAGGVLTAIMKELSHET